ncbi:hypothetical protein ALP86_05148, partial [Pseudomonas amygdali pv. mori]
DQLTTTFPTYTEPTSQLGFRFPEAQLPDCDGLFVGQGLLASPVSFTLHVLSARRRRTMR